MCVCLGLLTGFPRPVLVLYNQTSIRKGRTAFFAITSKQISRNPDVFAVRRTDALKFSQLRATCGRATSGSSCVARPSRILDEPTLPQRASCSLIQVAALRVAVQATLQATTPKPCSQCIERLQCRAWARRRRWAGWLPPKCQPWGVCTRTTRTTRTTPTSPTLKCPKLIRTPSRGMAGCLDRSRPRRRWLTTAPPVRCVAQHGCCLHCLQGGNVSCAVRF